METDPGAAAPVHAGPGAARSALASSQGRGAGRSKGDPGPSGPEAGSSASGHLLRSPGRLRVVTGTLTADVARQADGAPLVLVSYYAEAKVQGAVLKVHTDPEFMRFDLTEGKLRVTRRIDQIFVDLEPGQYVIVGEGN